MTPPRSLSPPSGIYVLLIKEGARADWRTGQRAEDAEYFAESVDIHHIFPTAWCASEQIPPGRYNFIVNPRSAPVPTGSSVVQHRPCISARGAGNAEVKAAVVSDHLRTHLADPVLPARDDSDAFFAAPQEALARAIERATGKAVVIGEGYPDNEISHEDVGKDEGDGR